MGARRFRTDDEVRSLLNIDANGVPLTVSIRQARLVLSQQGILTAINNAVSAMDQTTQISWEYATELRRDNALLAQVAASISPPLSATDVDNLFRTAATL